MSTTDRITEIQAMLREAGLDGWLLYDFRRSNILAYRILQLPPALWRPNAWRGSASQVTAHRRQVS